MKIYAVTDGDCIVALTVNKECAKRFARVYNANIEEYKDAQELPKTPMREYYPHSGSCWLLEPYDSPTKEGIVGGIVYVRAEDINHARKKARNLISRYEAEKEGIT